MLAFESLAPESATPSSGRVLARLCDGLGFRFRWATEGLSEAEYAFRPHPDCMSIGELVTHVTAVVEWVARSVWPGREQERPAAIDAQRLDTLDALVALRGAFASMSHDELLALRIGDDRPFWNLLNGPLADVLTHVGQINSFRRMAGNPTPKANVFLGRPPSR